MSLDVETLLRDLIRCPSVTPDEAGALDTLEAFLAAAGFHCHRLVFSEAGTPDVDNLFARFGDGAPHFCFAGHTDVVPPGDAALWRHPPFGAVVEDGIIYGRGACDMKGSVAAFAVAAAQYLSERSDRLTGSISLLITGDEEGPSINGTAKVLHWMADNGHVPDMCLVGEPTCSARLGDTIKVGRRGSIHFEITSHGMQGHSAYPDKAFNPIPPLARLTDRLSSTPLDEGADNFDPSTLAFTTFDVGNPAGNVVPQTAVARCNIRFNTRHTPDSLKAHFERQADLVARETGGRFSITSSHNADCFHTAPGPLVEHVGAAIAEVTGAPPAASTSGGTSDARFIKDHCPVVEFGPLNTTIHQIDECLGLAELDQLTAIYRAILVRVFGNRAA